MKVLLVGLGLLLSVGSARAERPKVGDDKPLDKTQQAPWDRGVSAEQMRAAAAAFDEANEQLDASLPSKAADKYNEALKLWPHPMIHYNLALALIELKRPVEVADHLEKAIEHGVEGLNNQSEKLDQARRLLEFTKDQLAYVEVSCQKEGAKITIDGKHAFTVEKGKPNIFKGRIPIGKHTFVAEKPGYATPVDAPFIGGRETFRIELKLYTADELTRYKRRWPKRAWVPWAAIGGGALLGLVGGGLQWSATSSYDQFNTELKRCSSEGGGLSCDASGFTSLRDSGDTKQTLGTIGYGIAGAAIVTGGLLLYLNRRISYQITTDEYRMEELKKQQKQQSKPVSLVPFVGPGVGGAMVMGRL
jgi:tetratricopeptide (TPR) repeat protein